MTKDVIPQMYFGKFTYYSDLVNSASTTSPGVHNFSANSLFDPDQTGTGHQPRGFDQLKLLYNRYKVYAVNIKLTAQLASGANSLGVVGVRFFNEDAITTFSVSDMKENPRAWTVKSIDGQHNKIIINKYSKLYKIAGLSKKQWDADVLNYGAGTGASPTYQPRITVSWSDIDESTSFTPAWSAVITYYAVLWDRVHLAES